MTGVCVVPFASGPAVVSTSLDRTARLWDPGAGRMLRAIPVHHDALACEFVDGVLVLGLDRGMLALTFDDPFSPGVGRPPASARPDPAGR